MNQQTQNIAAQARIHHAFLLGLQLMLVSHKSPTVVGEWMYRLFLRQHRGKFLSSFAKLGLDGLPDAVACAQYHVMSNNIGGVPVEYIYENDKKAWVRFRYPRWMYQGPVICGIPVEVSRGFLRGWYAQNGISLNNPRLGFVCVSEDMTGEFGFCGYFKEFDHDLADDQRLQFARGELPPAYNAEEQPVLLANDWGAERLEKANRNYAMGFIRSGLAELAHVIGEKDARELGGRAARLIGLQYLMETRQLVGVEDGDLSTAVAYLSNMFDGLGDKVVIVQLEDRHEIELVHSGLRIVRDLPDQERDLVLACWQQLWVGALASYREMKKVNVIVEQNQIRWQISDIK